MYEVNFCSKEVKLVEFTEILTRMHNKFVGCKMSEQLYENIFIEFHKEFQANIFEEMPINMDIHKQANLPYLEFNYDTKQVGYRFYVTFDGLGCLKEIEKDIYYLNEHEDLVENREPQYTLNKLYLGVTKNDNGDIIPLDILEEYKRYEYDGEQNIDGYEIIAYASTKVFYETLMRHEYKVIKNLETELYYFIKNV